MIVDSSALLAVLLMEPDSADYAAAIARAARPLMSAASYVEVSLKLDRLADGMDPALDESIAALRITLVPLTVEQAQVARAAFDRFGRGAARLNFGDCLTYALARSLNEPLLFKGNDFIHTDLVPALPAGVTNG